MSFNNQKSLYIPDALRDGPVAIETCSSLHRLSSLYCAALALDSS